MYRFGSFELDVPARELRRAGVLVHLEPQAFDLLVHLLEQRDRVVPKEDLLDGVWGHRFLSDANLTTRVKEIRRGVDDDGTRQHTIANVRGRGYRFVGTVEVVDRTGGVRLVGVDAGLTGRDDEVAALVARIPSSPMLTLLGPGGVGKSTLARAVAAAMRPTFADGLFFVELSALHTGDDVLAAVTRDLGVALERDHRAGAVLRITRLDALVVLDNCEHVADQTAALVDLLLREPGGRVRLLATSRVRLGLSVEEVVAVRPLAPDQALELFVARAAAVRPAWALGEIGRARVDRLLDGLDRLPLTIEMAAARLGAMTFDELEAAISDGRPLVQLTHRAPTRRHRTLESLVAWSAELLEPEARRVFTEFSVFAGPVTAADAGAVVAPGDARTVAFQLASLSECSLLMPEPDGPTTRYRMLATVRAVARGWLDRSGGADGAGGRHAEHVAEVIVEIDDDLRTRNEARGRQRLDAMIAEVRAAHRWAQQHRPGLASQMSGGLYLAAYSGFWNEPAEWSRTLVAEQAAGEHPLLGAKVTAAAAAANRGDLDAARRWASAAATAGTGRVRATALEVLADVALYEGDLVGVLGLCDELARLGHELGDGHVLAMAAVDTALARAYGADPEIALDRLASFTIEGLAPSDQAWLVYARGEALSALGDPSAASLFVEAIDLAGGVGNRFVTSVAQMSLATEHARAGDVGRALDTFAACLRGYLRHGNLIHAVTTLRNLVEVLVSVGDDHGALVLAAAASAEHLRASYGAEAARLSDVVASAAARVGAARSSTWAAEGRSLDLERALVAAAELVDRHRA